MKIQAVLFDLDGVLIESKQVWFALLNAAARHFRAPPVTQEIIEKIWGSSVGTDAEILFPGISVEQIADYYNEHFLDHVAEITVNPDAANVLQHLTGAGLRHAVVTNTPQPAAWKILRHAGLNPELVVGGTDVPRPKPAPDMLLHALKELEMDAGAAVMVGDTSYDREAATAAGVRFAGYGTEGEITLERLNDLLPLVGVKG